MVNGDFRIKPVEQYIFVFILFDIYFHLLSLIVY
jgi:hypothetical protein